MSLPFGNFSLGCLSIAISLSFGLQNTYADESAEKGKMVFNGAGACMACHGAEGKGDGPAAAALTPKPASFAEGAFKYDTDQDGKTGTAEDLYNIVTNGAQKYGGSVMMAGRGDLSDSDRRALAAFVLSLKQ